MEYEAEINGTTIYAELVFPGEATLHECGQGRWFELEVHKEPKFEDFYYYKDEDLDNEQIQPDPYVINLATTMMETEYWDTYTEGI
jgi:hypothetical protein